jgi:hypothetical protein
VRRNKLRDVNPHGEKVNHLYIRHCYLIEISSKQNVISFASLKMLYIPLPDGKNILIIIMSMLAGLSRTI